MNDRLSPIKNAVKVGQITIRLTDPVKIIAPINMPVFRPRLSATEAKNGLIKPISEREVNAYDIARRSTPIPFAK